MIIDFHTHIFPPEARRRRERYLKIDATFAELYADPRARMSSAEELLEAMDIDGVAASVVMGVGWSDPGLARESNDYVIDAASSSNGRLIGFASANPTRGGAAAIEVDRCVRAGLRGVGELHPDTQSFDIGSPATMAPLMEVVTEHGLVVTTHSSEPVGHAYAGKGETRPEALWRFILNFPGARIVCAHWGGGLPFYALMPEVRESLGGVYFDTAASPFLYEPGVFEATAGLVGAERILFGSDFPLLRASRLLSQIDESGLSRSEAQAVKGGNAARLLGLPRPSAV